jgi:diacylglycerol kinase family enzyme
VVSVALEDGRADAQTARVAGTAILVNPGAGRDRSAEEQARLLERLRALPDTRVVKLDRKTPVGAAARAAVEAGHDTIVAAGGDGTISAVAGALAGTGRKLGLLPLGTFNFLARALGLPQDLDAALDVIREGRDMPLTVGEVNDAVFVNNASLGAYAAVLEARETVYGRWGRHRLAAYWSVLVAMLGVSSAQRMTITVDGEREEVRTPVAFVAVRPYQLETYELSGAEAVREGDLALILAPDCGRLALIWRALKIALRRTEPGRDYRLRTGREIVIETKRPEVQVARDGERERMRSPLTFRAREGAVTVRAPREARESA